MILRCVLPNTNPIILITTTEETTKDKDLTYSSGIEKLNRNKYAINIATTTIMESKAKTNHRDMCFLGINTILFFANILFFSEL